MAVKQNGVIDIAVKPDTVLTKDKTLLVLGDYKAMHKCFHI